MFHNILKLLRTSNKLTQQELADKLGVTQRTIAFYEKGERHPDYDVIVKIADIFSCSVDYLLGRTNSFNEVLKKPNKDEALVIIAKDSNVDIEKLKDYIEYLESKNKKN